MVTIGDRKDLAYYGIEPGDERGGIISGGAFVFKKDGEVFDLTNYKTSRRKKPSKIATAFALIKIGAIVDALIVATFAQWPSYSGFLAPLAEPQVRLSEQILKFLGL